MHGVRWAHRVLWLLSAEGTTWHPPSSGPSLSWFCVTPGALQPSPDPSVRGKEERKDGERFFSFLPRSSVTLKALVFAHLAASLAVLFLELYLQLNAVSFSGLFRPFRTSKGHLCWVDRSPSSIFLFSAYQAGVHFDIRSPVFFPFLMLDMNYWIYLVPS